GSMARSVSPAIVAEGVAAAYGDRLIWRNASFTVNTGEFVAVLGPNGSGKSTLLRLLLGLQPPAAGGLQVLGKRPLRGNPQIGYVPQRRNIDRDLPVRGRDFVHLGIDGNRWGLALGNAGSNHQRVDQAITSVGAHGGLGVGKPAEVITTEQLSRLYDAPIEVLHDSHGHMFVVGLEAESAHHDA